MSDFNPVTLYFILSESLGAWLWVLVALAVVRAAGIVVGTMRLRRAGRSAGVPLTMAVLLGAVVAVAATFAVPMWTLAGPDALTGGLDYAFALLFALVPAAIVGAVTYIAAALKRAGSGRLA